jgi:hypothetical protein
VKGRASSFTQTSAEYSALQMAGVQYVLSTVVQALLDNPDRRFSYAEMVSAECTLWHPAAAAAAAAG